MSPTALGYTEQATTGFQPGARASLSPFTGLLWVQGLYYLVTGVWPLVSIETFQMVTGPKTDHLVTGRETDHWLVMTVGVLVTAVGLGPLLAPPPPREPPPETAPSPPPAPRFTRGDNPYFFPPGNSPAYLVPSAGRGGL